MRATLAISVLVAMATWVLARGTGGGTAPPPADANEIAVETIAAVRTDLIDHVSVVGQVGHGPSILLAPNVVGTVTAHPEIGSVVAPGEQLVRVDDRPLFLARGSMPLFRDLVWVRREPLEGQDVRQLQRFLRQAGFPVGIDGVFGHGTHEAVGEWQAQVGHPATGRIDASQLAFGDHPVRIEAVNQVGTPFDGVEVTDPDPVVTARVDASNAAAFKPGAPVAIRAPGQERIGGTVTRTSATVGPDGLPQLEVTIAVAESLPANVLSVEVSVEIVVATDVVALPARALLPLADGSWIVELVDPSGGVSQQPIEIGDDAGGMVEVRAGVVAGDNVVVPR